MVTRKQLAKGVARKARAAARLGERDRTLNRTIQVCERGFGQRLRRTIG
jgi:hypothetical protein